MRIHFERTGGIAGMRIKATIDTQRLPGDEAQEVQRLVETTGFFGLPAELRSPTPGMDQFHFILTIEAGERSHTVSVGDAAAPDELRPLLRRLTILARSS